MFLGAAGRQPLYIVFIWCVRLVRYTYICSCSFIDSTLFLFLFVGVILSVFLIYIVLGMFDAHYSIKV